MAFEQYLPWSTRMEQLTDKLDDIIAELELFLDEAPDEENSND